jgi:uncharacterized protein YdeI (YjbR/CyaY-like superfamily)
MPRPTSLLPAVGICRYRKRRSVDVDRAGCRELRSSARYHPPPEWEVPEAPQDARLARMAADLPVLTVPDLSGWACWLETNHAQSNGVWLTLAKKGASEPTRLSYDDALAEALCYGWIDGRLSGGDDRTFRRTFTPRRPGSAWSKRNVTIATMLIEDGRMRRSGLAAVSRAKADGTWDAAYDGQATIEVPPDLAAALVRDPSAKATFDMLSASNRYAILYRVTTAKRPDTRCRRIEQFVAMLARGEAIYPQRDSAPRRKND